MVYLQLAALESRSVLFFSPHSIHPAPRVSGVSALHWFRRGSLFASAASGGSRGRRGWCSTPGVCADEGTLGSQSRPIESSRLCVLLRLAPSHVMTLFIRKAVCLSASVTSAGASNRPFRKIPGDLAIPHCTAPRRELWGCSDVRLGRLSRFMCPRSGTINYYFVCIIASSKQTKLKRT